MLGCREYLIPFFIPRSSIPSPYGVNPDLINENQAEVFLLNTDVWKEMDDIETWYLCYHEVGHIKFWLDGYPIIYPLGLGNQRYPPYLNAEFVASEKLFPRYPETAPTMLKDSCERHHDHLVDSNLAKKFPHEMIEILKRDVNQNIHIPPLVPPEYVAFLVTVDQASSSLIYKQTETLDAYLENLLTKKISETQQYLPDAAEISENAKKIFSLVKFTTDANVILDWSKNFFELMPAIEFPFDRRQSSSSSSRG